MKDKKAVKKTGEKDSDEEKYFTDLGERWNIHTGFRALTQDNDIYQPAVVVNKTGLPLPRVLAWHSAVVFTNWDKAWQVVYARGTNAVVLERKFGKGSVVMATDSYFVSNEALARDRHADLLAWLVGAGNNNVVFDEAHFGLVETSGVATLMRKYRLHGLAAGLLLLAALFIWKNSTSLVPPPAEETADAVVAGKDATAGFINLLRRSIAPRDLLTTCFAEWKKAAGPTGRIAPARVQEAEAIVASESGRSSGDRDPVGAYQKISETLGIRNKQL